ncbi:lactaldehyde reductase, partial [Enterococcus avium]
EEMALGQYIAGMGFSNVGLGLVHGMAHPLSAWYNIPHGVACAALLPTVMKFNKDFTGEKYRKIAEVLQVEAIETMSIEEARTAACEAIDQLSKDVGIPATISELGVKSEDLPKIAEDAFKDVCTPGNPRDTSVSEIIELYQSLM